MKVDILTKKKSHKLWRVYLKGVHKTLAESIVQNLSKDVPDSQYKIVKVRF